MSKTGIKTIQIKGDDPDYGYEAVLWQDDESDELSVSLPDPFHGITRSSDMRKLAKFCTAVAERMKKRGQ